MPIPLLMLVDRSPRLLARLREAGFDLHLAADPLAFAAAGGPATAIRAVHLRGSRGLSAAEMAALPALEIICTVGVGYEKVDMQEAARRGITVCNSAGANASAVADHALALILALLRAVPQGDAAVRRGEWDGFRRPRPELTGKRLGLLGIGAIGQAIAARAAGGFGTPVAYHSRHSRPDLPYAHHADPVALADWAEILVVATPGGAATRGLVDAAVLRALGPAGHLVNVARGSVVDGAALVAALRDGVIAGAALDVVEGEPAVPADLLAAPNLIITPHIAGLSPEATEASARLLVDNLVAHFAGRPVLTPVTA
jgi:lactate dehydrogenase-like 2-hydroxyacid dehydrogenase